MHLQHLPSKSTLLQVGAIALVIAAAFVPGLSLLIYPSPYAPLLVEGAIVATVVVLVWLRRPLWALYAALFVVFLPTGLIPANIHSILNRAFTVAAVVIWAVDAMVHHRRIVWTSATIAMLGFLAWGLLTLLWANDFQVGLNALLTYALRLALFLILVPNHVRTKQSLGGLLNTLALDGWAWVLAGAGAALQGGYAPGTRLQVLETNQNALGGVVLFALPGVLWWAIQARKRHKALRKWIVSTFLALALGLTALSGSRGGAISLVLMLLGLCVWKPTRLWGMQGLLFLALGALLAPSIFSTTIQRFGVLPGDTMLGGREALWQAAWRLGWRNPWLGVGIGNGTYAIMPYVTPLRNVWQHEQVSIHNPVLTIWVETGAPGLLLYLTVLGSALWSFARRCFQSRMGSAAFLTPYFAIVSSAFLGYAFSWIKGGGVESDFTCFMMVALLVIPSCLDTREAERPVAMCEPSREDHQDQRSQPAFRLGANAPREGQEQRMGRKHRYGRRVQDGLV